MQIELPIHESLIDAPDFDLDDFLVTEFKRAAAAHEYDPDSDIEYPIEMYRVIAITGPFTTGELVRPYAHVKIYKATVERESMTQKASEV